MYVIPSSPHTINPYQGDILKDFPLFDLSTPRAIEEINETILYADFTKDATLAAVTVEKRNVMLLSQSCDAENRKYLILCPIYTVEEYIASDQPNADTLRSLRSSRIYYWFYLPAETGVIEESFLDFQQFFYVPREKYHEYGDGNKMLQLNDLGRHRLAWAISSYFGRPL